MKRFQSYISRGQEFARNEGLGFLTLTTINYWRSNVQAWPDYVRKFP